MLINFNCLDQNEEKVSADDGGSDINVSASNAKGKREKAALIVCGGEIKNTDFYKDYFDYADYIIAADGGASLMKKSGSMPDLLLGDFDSISKEDYQFYLERKVEIQKFPVEKDMTDSELAVEIAAEKGYRNIVLIGAAGSRLDHTLANIMLLKKMFDRGIKGIIANENNEVTLIKSSIVISGKEGYKVSLIPLSMQVTGVTTQGLYYPLKDAVINMGSTWGISNEFVSDKAKVTLKSGLLLVTVSRD